jgi:Tol biopolymer transport system component/predicted Ser/Thr protein kinase
MALAAGAKLGPYEILALIGAGGMGEVYKARDTRLDRTVAIKVSQEKFSERFEREARSIAALNHPHICQLYDVGPDYLVMEYIDGAPLKGPLPLDQAMKYAGQICDALDAAHKKNITHRDLKPANIMVTKAGVKLLDFGLARIATSPDDTLTMVEGVMGTPAYMAPEQWEGKPGDARSDIYALGCVLYELVTGKRVSPERSAMEPAALEQVLRTCLEKDADERWQSAHDVKRALELTAVGQVADLPGPARGRIYLWIVAAVILVAAATLLATWRVRSPAPGEVVTFSVYPPEKTTFSAATNTTASVPQFALSPHGRTLAFIANTPGGAPMLWLRPLADVAAHPLPGTENAEQPFWNPDNRWLGFYGDGKVKKVPAAGGAVQVVAETRSDLRGGAWGADDTILWGSGSEPVYGVNAQGGEVTPVTAVGALEMHRYPAFLPEGRRFLYLMRNNSESSVYVGSLDGKTKKLLIHANSSAIYAPGYLLFVQGDTLMGQAFDPDRLETQGRPFLVAEHAGHSSAFYSAVSASPGGTLAYASTISPNGRLTWFDRSGNMLGSAGLEADYTDFRLSPDEKSLAASLVDPKTGTIDIWINDLKRNSMSRFTSGWEIAATPAWSSDGGRLMYRAAQFGLIRFFQRSAGGGGSEEPLLTFEMVRAAQIRSTNLIPTDWSPDGAHIIFSVPDPATGNDLWIVSLTGEKKAAKFLATPADEMHGNFSPDGKLVAYTSNESGKFGVYVETFPRSDRKWPVSTTGGYEPRWRADGREIYYLSEDRKLMAVPVGAGPSFGVPQVLFQTRTPAGVTTNRMHYVPSRDGKRFLVNTLSGDPPPTPITVVLNWTAGLKK